MPFEFIQGARMEQVEFYADIVKVDLDLRQIAGWSSVYAIDGNPVVDRQGDRVEETEVRKAAHRFMREHRVVKAMHDKPLIYSENLATRWCPCRACHPFAAVFY